MKPPHCVRQWLPSDSRTLYLCMWHLLFIYFCGKCSIANGGIWPATIKCFSRRIGWTAREREQKPINFQCKSFSASLIQLINAWMVLFCVGSGESHQIFLFHWNHWLKEQQKQVSAINLTSQMLGNFLLFVSLSRIGWINNGRLEYDAPTIKLNNKLSILLLHTLFSCHIKLLAAKLPASRGLLIYRINSCFKL